MTADIEHNKVEKVFEAVEVADLTIVPIVWSSVRKLGIRTQIPSFP